MHSHKHGLCDVSSTARRTARTLPASGPGGTSGTTVKMWIHRSAFLPPVLFSLFWQGPLQEL
eukprot:2911635-Alexandrium_andersonii.AAC.1